MSAGAEEDQIPPSDSILFILVAFGVGIFIRLCLKWTKIPYTAMLLLWGLMIGFLQLSNPATVAFTNTLKLWLSMEPHLLLLIFLPIIGFSAGISQEPHMLRKSWGQIMLLAWPGVVIQFLLIAICAKYFFPYSWSWPEAFLFGAMLSATDPVAVVAVLQEVGASQKLACVIDGESLMNDGSALVIFLLLQKIVEGEQVTVGGAIAQFCLLAVVGMVLGVAFGTATSWLLDNIFRDPTLTTVVTLISAYSSYYTADRLVGASGLLAVVCNGFTMSLIGGRQITMRVEDAMHGFWSVLEWGANTILFVWMGIVLAIVLPPSHEQTAITNQPIHLEPRDAGYVVVLYLWLQLARAALILVCWIPFNYTGYPLTWRSALIIIWGGLRGAVGMVMALFIFLDTKIHDPSFKSYCIFYMGTMAFFTVLINGGTCKALLRWLGFMSYTPEQLGTLQHIVEDMDDIREQRLAKLQPDEVLGEPEPDVVKVWSQLPTEQLLSDIAAKTVRPQLDTASPSYQAAVAAGLDPQLLFDYRSRVLNMVKAHYAEVYDQHLLSTLQARTLQSVTDAALDEAAEGLKDWKLLEPNCKLRGLPKLMHAWQLHKVSSTLVQATTYSHSLSNLQLLVGFIHAHRHAQEVLRQHIRAVAEDEQHSPFQDPADHLAGHNPNNNATNTNASPFSAATDILEGMRGGAEARHVLQESEDEAAAAIALAEGITRSHPSLPAWLRSKQAAGEILTEQHTFLQHLADAGLVQPREVMLFGDLMHEQFKALLQGNSGLAAAIQYSRNRPPLNVLPLFDSLGDAEAAELMKHCSKQAQAQGTGTCGSSALQWKVYYPEQTIAQLGSSIDHIVIVAKGAVRMRFPVVAGPHGRAEEHTVVASVGDPLAVCEIMLGLPRMSELTADTMVQALLVPTANFLQLVAAVPGIRTRAWQATAAQLAAQHHHILGQHKQLAPLNYFFRNCTVERVQPGQVFEVPRTALLLTGSVEALMPLPASSALYRDRSGAISPIARADSSSSSRGSSPPPIPIRGSSSGSLSSIDEHHLLVSSSSNAAAAAAASAAASAAATANGVMGGSPQGSCRNLAEQQQQQQRLLGGEESRVLSAPAELPPGDFKGLTESMILQVPRGPELPSHLETTTYQAQVLSKGSISLRPSGVGNTPSDEAGSNGGFGPKSPLRGVLSRVSRQLGLGRTASDSVPSMPFLQKALASMRAEQQQQVAAGAGAGAGVKQSRMTPAAAAAAGANGGLLHSVSEGAAGGEKATSEGGKTPPSRQLLQQQPMAAAGDLETGRVPSGNSAFSPYAATAAADCNAADAAVATAAALPRATHAVHQHSSAKRKLGSLGSSSLRSRASSEGRGGGTLAPLGGSAAANQLVGDIGRLSSSSLTRRSSNSLS